MKNGSDGGEFARAPVKTGTARKISKNPNHSAGNTRLWMNVAFDEIRFKPPPPEPAHYSAAVRAPWP